MDLQVNGFRTSRDIFAVFAPTFDVSPRHILKRPNYRTYGIISHDIWQR